MVSHVESAIDPENRRRVATNSRAILNNVFLNDASVKKLDSYGQPWLTQDPSESAFTRNLLLLLLLLLLARIYRPFSPVSSFLCQLPSPRRELHAVLFFASVFSCLRLVPRDCIPAIEFRGIFALPGRRYELPATVVSRPETTFTCAANIFAGRSSEAFFDPTPLLFVRCDPFKQSRLSSQFSPLPS